MDEIRYISSFDNEFPERLRTIPDPPQGIYVKGKLPDPNRPSVSIIGARACSEYGKGAAEYFAKKLAENGIQIISGMARGIDGIAQRTAVDAGYESFGVLGNGIDIVYPRENSRLYETILNKGGLISEFPPGTQGLPAYFPKRNRIISGLCNVLLVIEARAKSGTLSTVCHALNQGREIFAVPGRISDPLSVGCNRLIADGAGIASTADDILEILGIVKRKKKGVRTLLNPDTKELPEEERSIMALLDFSPTSISYLQEKTKLEIPILTQLLLSLELKGFVERTGPAHYIKKIR